MEYTTREAWLDAACLALTPEVETACAKTMPPLKLSCGFPSKAPLARSNRRIGECWPTEKGGAHAHVFVSPLLTDPVEVLAVLVHELIHAADNCKSGHKGLFKRAMKKLGLEGKATATVAGDALKGRLNTLAESLGLYPHPGLMPVIARKKQGTRMLKLTCGECGLIVRATRGAIDEHGLPEHCSLQMLQA
jgi:hypothetical protein